MPRRGFRSLLKRGRGGFSLVEMLIVSLVMIASLLLVFQMLRHLSLWWALQENGLERTAAARHVVQRVSDMLLMAGYRASVRGIHSLGSDRLTVEYLVEGADEDPGEFSRHRLFTVWLEGGKIKLLTRRRRLPLEGEPSWGEGSTATLAEEVEEIVFRYYDARGRETDNPLSVRLVCFTMKLRGSSRYPREAGGLVYRASVFLRNLHG